MQYAIESHIKAKVTFHSTRRRLSVLHHMPILNPFLFMFGVASSSSPSVIVVQQLLQCSDTAMIPHRLPTPWLYVCVKLPELALSGNELVYVWPLHPNYDHICTTKWITGITICDCWRSYCLESPFDCVVCTNSIPDISIYVISRSIIIPFNNTISILLLCSVNSTDTSHEFSGCMKARCCTVIGFLYILYW